MRFLHSDMTGKIIKAFYEVYNKLGYGFLEKVYQSCVEMELRSMNLFVEVQKPIKVIYKGKEVGLYYADIVVENCVIVELKAAEMIAPEFEAQLLNYLKASTLEVGLLLNVGIKPELRRKIYDNSRKSFE